ncbi:MAG: hypothetical protein Kow00108_23400 [Calditrichia bacterium]
MKDGISLCMIVKNEERFLRECLESAQSLVDEIIIVDTGSTDRTVSIAKEFTSLIYQFEWIDDFAAARNFAKSKANYNWILSLDADERLQHIHPDARDLILNSGIAAFEVSIFNKTAEDELTNFAIHSAIRLFRNQQDIYFENKVHEDVSKSLYEHKYDVKKAPFDIIHLGYFDSSQSKQEYMLRLLEREINANPSDFAMGFYYGNQLFILKRYRDALVALKNAEKNYLEGVHSLKLILELKLRKAYCFLELDKPALALQEVEELLGMSLPEKEMIHYLLFAADIYSRTGLQKPALNVYQNIIGLMEQNPALEKLINKSKVFFQMGRISYQAKDLSGAYRYFTKVLDIESGNENALLLAGMSALLKGDNHNARRHLEQTLMINPNNQTAQKGLQILK